MQRPSNPSPTFSTVSTVPLAADEPTRRIILTGASNLTRGLATIAAMARKAWSSPLDVMAAPGNGRSYGWTTNVLGRQLGGIIDSGLWRAWDERPPLPTVAVVTDVGNDVMYGASVEQILAWVDTVLERLAKREVKTVVTGLPLERLSRLNERQYVALRTLLFPGNRTDFASARRRSEAVDEGLRRRAERFGATFVEPHETWYGWDPIHVRRTAWGAAWSRVLTALAPPQPAHVVRVRPWTWIASQLWRPEERRVFGILQRRAQPSVYFADGSRLSLF